MSLKEPQIKTESELNFVGLSEHVRFNERQNIASQWRRFMSKSYGEIDNRIGEPPTGITTSFSDDGIDYVCAAGVKHFGNIPSGCLKLTVAPAKYVVFAHDGNVAELRGTYDAIWKEWFPKSGKMPAQAPSLERHKVTFNPLTGDGGVTIWIPLQN